MAARLLQGRGEPNTAYEVTGPEALSFAEVSGLIRELSGARIAIALTREKLGEKADRTVGGGRTPAREESKR